MNPSIEIAFAENLAEMLKQAGAVQRAKGLARIGELISGSREKALRELGKGRGADTARRAARVANHEAGKVQKARMATGALSGPLVAAAAYGAKRLTQKGKEKKAEDEQLEEPNYNKTLRRIALRQAGVTAKEIGAVTLPLAAGVGVGYGIEKYLKSQGKPVSPIARKIVGISSIPAVGLTAGAMYSSAKRLKEQHFQRIRDEELGKYQNALDHYQRSLKRAPVPEEPT